MRCHIAPAPGGLPDDLGGPRLPGSKSHTQRALLAAAFRHGSWRLHDALRSDDTDGLLAAVQRCGARTRWDGNTLEVHGRDPHAALDVDLEVGENGTAARTLLVLIPMLGGRVRIDGAAGLRRRPMAAALAVLRACGIRPDREELPIQADGRGVVFPTTIPVDAGITTQVASGVLLAAAARGGGTVLVHGSRAPAFVQLTAAVLDRMGARIEGAAQLPRDGEPWRIVVRGQIHDVGEFAVPPDPSARAFPLALAALHGIDGSRRLPPLVQDPHPDWGIDADLRLLREARTGAVVLQGLGARPDCVPAVAVVAAARHGITKFASLPALRVKESDRLHAMATLLQAAGARCAVEGDDLVVEGPIHRTPAGPVPKVLPVVRDHRIVMAAALLGTVLPGGVLVDHADAVAKSWPGFFDWLARCAAVARA